MTPQESSASHPECGKLYGTTDQVSSTRKKGGVEECSRLKVM